MRIMALSLKEKIEDTNQGVYLIGTTPPKIGTDKAQLKTIAEKLLGRLHEIEYDGVIIYDIQDESSRTNQARPFAFKQTVDPREYSHLLRNLSAQDVITYKSVAQRGVGEFKDWLSETAQGCQFFISQAVYDAQATIELITSYARTCKAQGITPQRIILTFTPCGGEKTLEFMQWLGISVPEATKWRMLDADNTLSESVRICRENLDLILKSCAHLDVPLGLNIESLTNRKEEIDASINLYRLLKAIMELNLAEKLIA